MAEGLHVVAQPVVAAQEELGSHVVDILVDVQNLANLVVGGGIGGIGREGHQVAVGEGRTALLHVERVGRDFKHLNLVIVPAVVGIDVVLVVGLAHVQHADVLAVEELMHGLVGLQVDVDACRLHDGGDGGVLDAADVVVATVANLQRAVVDVGLGLEEGIFQLLRAAQFLGSFQFEGMGSPGTAPPTAHLEVYVLIEHHLALGIEVGEVDGALPVHVPVALRLLSVAGAAVGATHVDAQRVVVEESRVAHHAHHGQSVVVAVAEDEGSGGGGRRQVAVGEEAETVVGGLADAELPGGAGAPVLQRGQRAVYGVAQCAAGGNVDAQRHGAADQLRGLVDRRCCQLLLGEGGRSVRGAGRSCRRGAPLIAAVGLAGIADALHRGGIVLREQQIACSVADVEHATIGVEAEGRVGLADVVGVEPHHLESVGRHHTQVFRRVPLLQVVGIVADVDAAHFHALVSQVIEFHPAVEVERRAHVFVNVRGHDLVHHDGSLGEGIARHGDVRPSTLAAAVGGCGIDAGVALVEGRHHALVVDRHHVVVGAGPLQFLLRGILGQDVGRQLELLANHHFVSCWLQLDTLHSHGLAVVFQAEVVEQAPVALHEVAVAQSYLQVAARVGERHLVLVSPTAEGVGTALHRVGEVHVLAPRRPATAGHVAFREVVAVDAGKRLLGVAGIHHAADFLRAGQIVRIPPVVFAAAVVGLHRQPVFAGRQVLHHLPQVPRAVPKLHGVATQRLRVGVALPRPTLTTVARKVGIHQILLRYVYPLFLSPCRRYSEQHHEA